MLIGLVTQGQAAGRTREEDITIFDNSGVAIQDLTIARAIVELATDLGLVGTTDF